MEYRDEMGQLISAEDFHGLMGNVQVHERPHPERAGWVVGLIQIHRNCPAEMCVGLLQEGWPAAGRRVAWYWPDAPVDPNAGWYNRADTANTNTGNGGWVALCMGGGAYYFPPAGGPHAVWVYGSAENSEMVDGLGMVGGTNHDHVDVFFRWYDPGAGDDEALALLRRIDFNVELLRRRFIPGVVWPNKATVDEVELEF